jgi:hypothetical protein
MIFIKFFISVLAVFNIEQWLFDSVVHSCGTLVYGIGQFDISSRTPNCAAVFDLKALPRSDGDFPEKTHLRVCRWGPTL